MPKIEEVKHEFELSIINNNNNNKDSLIENNEEVKELSRIL